MKEYTVYIHKVPNGKRYVGTTSQNPKWRFNNGKGYSFNRRFYHDILFYGWENIKHIIIAYNLQENEALMLERKLIKQYNTTNPEYGYNKFKGGERRGKSFSNIKPKDISIISFSERVKYLRQSKHLTQSELSEILGVSRQSIQTYESGISIPRKNNAIQLAKVLGVSYDELVNDDNCVITE